MTASKIVLNAASGLGGDPLNVENVFSNYLYTGTGSSLAITNDIDLEGSGGLVIQRGRIPANTFFFDTENGATKYVMSAQTTSLTTQSAALSSFNSDGFTTGTYGGTNASDTEYLSWTFRKAPKFFDIVKYTGNGTAGHNVSHNLGSVPGCIWVKRLDSAGPWQVFHRSMDATAPEDYYMQLNTQDQRANNNSRWNDTAPTSTQFTLGTNHDVNQSGGEYVAYLWAHNNGDGNFGPDGDQDIIKCGKYTVNSGKTFAADIGFEPQWVLIKGYNMSGAAWTVVDTMRGFPFGGGPDFTYARQVTLQATSAENNTSSIRLNHDGFRNSTGGDIGDYIYIAIRRGPMAVPEDADEVFDMANLDGTAPTYQSSTMKTVDMAFHKSITSSSQDYEIHDRVRYGANNDLAFHLCVNDTDAEATSNNLIYAGMDYMNGWGSSGSNTDFQSWMWRRAPHFFDVVCYDGTSSAQNVEHNLGVAPEMIWIKRRGATSQWAVYHSGANSGTNPANYQLRLNGTTAESGESSYFNNTAPTASVFTVNNTANTNGNNQNYVAYLFATLDGVSKVGHYTGSGSAGKQIDCGFTNGARFVLIKRVDTTGYDWNVFDTRRGINAGTDGVLTINNKAAEATGTDYVDPYNAGFSLGSSNAQVNASSARYVFYAIA